MKEIKNLLFLLFTVSCFSQNEVEKKQSNVFFDLKDKAINKYMLIGIQLRPASVFMSKNTKQKYQETKQRMIIIMTNETAIVREYPIARI